MQSLAIRHEGKSGLRFTVQRLGALFRSAETVELADPMVRRLGETQLAFGAELAWYLENYLDYPFGPNLARAERVLAALRAWGEEAFATLFGAGQARDFYRDAIRNGHDRLQLLIVSDTPAVLAWPWEALFDPQIGDLAHHCRIERSLDQIDTPLPLADNLRRDRIGILLVTARPYDKDIAFRSISRPLINLIAERGLPAAVKLLRPPTFKRLQQELRDNPGAYHIVHFDGHGGFGAVAAGNDRFKGPKGRLVFESADGAPDEITGEQLSQLLREHRIPIAVLNACQSAMIESGAEDAFASVAAALLRAGVRSVVAMRYALYVTAAREFLPAFYERLFTNGNVAEAVRAGRQALLAEPERRPGFELSDWLVPVLYQQDPLALDFANQASQAAEAEAPAIGEEARLGQVEHPYGLIGRDSAVLALERASHRPPAALLVHGLGGVGKTTLARGYIEWLAQTGGLHAAPIWLSFADVPNAEYVFDRLVEALFGTNAMALPDAVKWPKLIEALRGRPQMIVWDNFETASGAAGDEGGLAQPMPPEGLQRLKRFLEELRGGRTRVVITSRSDEAWLGTTACFRVPLGGLHGEERIELATAILRDQGVAFNSKDQATADLVNSLEGHPLMMRAILPRLGRQSAASILQALDAYAPESQSDDRIEQRLYAMFRFTEAGLPEALRPLLMPISLHVGFVDARFLAEIARRAGQKFTVADTVRTMALLEGAGLTSSRGNNVYSLHPGLTRYLRARAASIKIVESAKNWREAFVNVMAAVANRFAPRPLHEQHAIFHFFGASFEQARALAANSFETYAALTQSIATYALNRRNLQLAQRYFEELARLCEQHQRDDVAAGAYHQVGRVAEERHDLKAAEGWFLKSLAITEGLHDEHGAAATCHELGFVALERRDFNAAERWCLKALEIKQRLGNEHGAARTFHQLGRIAQERRDFDAAESWYLKSLEIKQRLNDEWGTASAHHQLGIMAQLRRDFDAAERWYLKSLEINERLNDEHGAAGTYHQLGMVALQRGDFDASERWCLKSLGIKERLNDEHGAAYTYHQLGMVAQERGDFDAAEPWYRKSLEIKERLNDEHGAALSYHQLGIVAQKRRDFDAAEQWYLKSLEIKERLSDEHGAATTYHQLGGVAEGRRDFDAAERWYAKALSIFDTFNDRFSSDMVRKHLNDLRRTGASPTMNIRQEISRLSDAAAIELLMAVARSQPPGDATPTQLDASIRENLTTTLLPHGEATPPASEGELARAALLLVADTPEHAEGIAALIANPPPKQFMDVAGAAMLVPAVLIVLQTHVKFERKRDGKWTLSIEKKPTDNELLKGLVKKLLGFT